MGKKSAKVTSAQALAYESAIREGFELAASYALFDCGDEIAARRILETKILDKLKRVTNS